MTFTTKKKKGENYDSSESSSSSSPQHPPHRTSASSSRSWSAVVEESSSLQPSAPVVKRGPGRPPRKKSLESNGGRHVIQSVITTKTSAVSSNPPVPLPAVSTSTTESLNSPPVKRKRGRPPKNRPKEESAESTDVLTTSSPLKHSNVQRNHVVKESDDGAAIVPTSSPTDRVTKLSMTKQQRHKDDVASDRNLKKSTSRKSSSAHPILMRTCSGTPPQEDIEGTLLNHTVTLAPILPPVLVHDNGSYNRDRNLDGNNDDSCLEDDDPQVKALKSKYPAVFGGGVPSACTSAATSFASSGQSSGSTLTSNSKQQFQQPQPPSWTPLCTPPVFFEDDYDRETGQLDVVNTIPVTRKITALSVRKPNHDYLALGDSAGFVLIYSLGKDNINRPVARLESVACQQRAKEEQERLRAELRRKRAKVKSSGNNGKSGHSAANSMGLALFSSNGDRPKMNSFAGPQQAQSFLMDTSETTIHALGMIGDRVVLATSVELECMDVPSATSLWVCPLSSNRFVTSLDMHLNTFDVLVSCSKTAAATVDASAATSVSSLMLLQHSKHNVEICDANSPMLVRSPSCTAIWDVGCDNRLLFVALSSNRQELELVLVSGGSIDTWKVACKTKIPIKSSSATNLATTSTKLSQSPGGLYTIVASSRGIRLYQTETLQLIHVYGDQLALHGQAVMWKDCWLAGSYFSDSKGCKKARGSSSALLEIDDLIAESTSGSQGKQKKSGGDDDDNDAESAEKSPASSSTPDLVPYVVGVPHIKGPKELCENLHVWKVEQPSVVPYMSIPLPPKGGGALGLVGGGGSTTAGGEDRIILVTNDGQGHALLPKMESNFAGIMYPPGYHVITDNIEFIEEEDALDQVVVQEEGIVADDDGEDEDTDVFGTGEEEEMDEELKEAMRQSLLEHKRLQEAREAMKHDQDVDILALESDEEPNYLPCRPEPYLRQFVNTGIEEDAEEESSEKQEVPNDKAVDASSNWKADTNDASSNAGNPPRLSGAVFVSNVLEALPNMEKPKPMEEDCLSFTTTKVVVAVNPVAVVPARPGRGRKSRVGNLEAMLKASINPYLQSMMLGKQGIAADGVGSRFKKVTDDGATGGNPKHLTPSTSNRAEIHACKSMDNPLRENGDSVPNDALAANTMPPPSNTPDPKTATADEAAVALGLLGLSPSPSTTSSKPADVLASVVPPKVPGVEVKHQGNGHGSAYLSASSLSSWAADHPAKPSVPAPGLPLNNLYNHGTGTAESLTASSDRGSVEESEGLSATTEQGGQRERTCSACRGRHVIHSCGKRALPIDYDEVAKAERERKAKEEEEKKRVRAEKRRLADQRRREAKRQKQRELEEQRLREEEEERLEKERQRRLQEDFASQDLNRQRREQIVASYAKYEQGAVEMSSVNYSRPQSSPPALEQVPRPQEASSFEQLSRPQFSGRFDDVSRPQVSGIFEQAARLIRPSSTGTDKRPASAGEAAASYRRAAHEAIDHAAMYQNAKATAPTASEEPKFSAASAPATTPFLNASAPAASARLGAADALAALASLADATAAASTKPLSVPATSGNAATGISSFSYGMGTAPSSLTSPPSGTPSSFGASHGFGGGAVSLASASFEAKRSIPSYAAIRGQINGDSTSSASNGNNQQTVETYVWPPRRED